MTAVLLSFGLLIGAIGRGPALHLAAGALFGLSVFYRTTNLSLALLGLGIVWLAPNWGSSQWLRTALAYIVPIGLAVLVIWLHAGAPLSVPPAVAEYVAHNTDAPKAHRDSYFQELVPNLLSLFLLGSALIAVVVALVMPRRATANRIWVGCTGTGGPRCSGALAAATGRSLLSAQLDDHLLRLRLRARGAIDMQRHVSAGRIPPFSASPSVWSFAARRCARRRSRRLISDDRTLCSAMSAVSLPNGAR